MNTSKILTGILFIGLTVGCYKDKGNYDYKQVNDFKIVLSPESTTEDNGYTVNQPAVTSYFTLTANVEQTLESGKDNLAFEWISATTVDGETVRDTVNTEEITLAFPPGTSTEYSLMCRVKDLTTDIEYYKSASVKTQVPFHDAWLLVHGAYGERKLGAIEWDVEGNMRWTADILETMGQQAFPYMTSITYTMFGGINMITAPECLLLTSEPDSSFAITPFDCKTMTNWNQMRPINFPNVRIAGKILAPWKQYVSFMGFKNETGRFFFGGNLGFFYEAWGDQVPGYHVDKFYINKEGFATLWDNKNKRFMYYQIPSDFMYAQDRLDNLNTAQIAYLEIIPAIEMQDKEILYAGRGTKSVGDQEETSLFIAKDEIGSYLYEFSYGKDGKDGKDDKNDGSNIGNVIRDTLHTLNFNKNTLFATSDAYNEQLFYTQENQLFRLILNSEESIPVHNVEGTIKQIAFRIPEKVVGYEANTRVIGLIVQKTDGTDEFQEIYLDTAGDVEDVKTYPLDGVTSIVDFTYTNAGNNRFKI